MQIRFSIALIAGLLTACGGDDGSNTTSPADSLFSGYSNVVAGEFRGTEDLGPGIAIAARQACARQPAISRAATEANVRASGGTVTTASTQQWCASLPGGPLCLTALPDDAYAVQDQAFVSWPRIDVSLVVRLGHGRYAHFDSSVSRAGSAQVREMKLRAMSPSLSDVPPSGRCDTFPDPFQGHPETIDGQWTGRRAVYDAINKTGYTELQEMTCSNQRCSITTGGWSNLAFTTFDPEGAWQLETEGLKGKAVLSMDAHALAMWICEDGSPTVNDPPLGGTCRMYGFTRIAP